MHKHLQTLTCLGTLLATTTHLSAIAVGIGGVDTPETIGLSVGIGNSFPANPDHHEYYVGPIVQGDSLASFHTAAMSGAPASLAWFKFTSDGVSDIILDTFGSTAAFSIGPLVGSPGTELAIYDANGNFVLKQSSVRAQPDDEPSNVAPVTNGYDATLPPLGNRVNNSPHAPLNPVARGFVEGGLRTIETIDAAGNVTLVDDDNNGIADYSTQEIWLSNQRGTSQIAFLNNPEPNPLWDPLHPDHDPNADWDQYPILPAGDYFIAQTGGARFSGFAPDMVDRTPEVGDYVKNDNGNHADNLIPDDGAGGAVRFGFTSIHPNGGIMVLNARKPGDFDSDVDADADDIDTLFDRVAALSGQGLDVNTGVTLDGLPLDFLSIGADNWEPEIDMSFNDHMLDLTGNSRIDMGDVTMLIHNILATEFGDANLDGIVDSADELLVTGNLNTAGGWADGDFNGDDMVTQADLDILLSNLPGLDGDLNGDGFVGIDDLNIVLSNWNLNVPPANPLADPSGDGFVGIDDLNEVLGNWNAGTPPPPGNTVPEPATFFLLAAGLVGLGKMGRMSHRRNA